MEHTQHSFHNVVPSVVASKRSARDYDRETLNSTRFDKGNLLRKFLRRCTEWHRYMPDGLNNSEPSRDNARLDRGRRSECSAHSNAPQPWEAGRRAVCPACPAAASRGR
eukprot:6173335-Pleurochrysis_carterae.AAC.3